jgi:hypothetical protein
MDPKKALNIAHPIEYILYIVLSSSLIVLASSEVRTLPLAFATHTTPHTVIVVPIIIVLVRRSFHRIYPRRQFSGALILRQLETTPKLISAFIEKYDA